MRTSRIDPPHAMHCGACKSDDGSERWACCISPSLQAGAQAALSRRRLGAARCRWCPSVCHRSLESRTKKSHGAAMLIGTRPNAKTRPRGRAFARFQKWSRLLHDHVGHAADDEQHGKTPQQNDWHRWLLSVGCLHRHRNATGSSGVPWGRRLRIGWLTAYLNLILTTSAWSQVLHSNVRRSWSGSGAGSMRASDVSPPHFGQGGR